LRAPGRDRGAKTTHRARCGCLGDPGPGAGPGDDRAPGGWLALRCRLGSRQSRRSCVSSGPRGSRGFTLIEILVVITVIAILAGLVSPMVFRNVGDAKVTAAKAQIETFGLALDTYRMDNDYYPTTEQGLSALQAIP